jgi:hypothetical protein
MLGGALDGVRNPYGGSLELRAPIRWLESSLKQLSDNG